ncbi:MAG: hypothetical protein WC678_01230 [Parcubacteria group bacterium]|jgi:hypothetical protein
MKNLDERPFAKAMAFYHQDGLPAAWKQAINFAGKKGRLATMPDIVAARLATKPGDAPWETYYTTLTAEYLGFSKSGKRILIIAHGIGPMATLDGIIKTYSWQFKDKERNRRGGRITQQEFWDLEAGKYGDISIIPFDTYCLAYKYPFMEVIRSSKARIDPVLQARLGPLAKQYVDAHTDYARKWHLEQAGITPENKCEKSESDFQDFVARRKNLHEGKASGLLDPFVIEIQDASNCCYTFGPEHGHRPIEDGYAIAHLISTGRLTHLHHERNESLVLNVGCHEWNNGVRLVGIQAEGEIITGIQPGPDAYNLLRKHWKELFEPVCTSNIIPVCFCALVQIGEQWFTQYSKEGEGMDNWEPEYVVTSMEEIGEPLLFRTTVGGYHGLFKFGTKEVQAIAPPTANAYRFVSEPQNEWHDGNPTHQTAMVQFFRIEADTSKRLIRSNQLRYDYERMMELLTKEDKAA